MTLFWGENQRFYQNKSIFFCNLTDKVFKIYSYYLSCFRFDDVLFNFIHVGVYTYKDLPTYFRFFLQQNPPFSYPGILWEMHVLLLLVYLGIAILRK